MSSSAVADAPSGPSGADNRTKPTPDSTGEISPVDAAGNVDNSDKGFMHKPVFAHASGGPTGGLLEKIKELQQRFENTPGVTYNERYEALHTAAADYTQPRCCNWVAAVKYSARC